MQAARSGLAGSPLLAGTKPDDLSAYIEAFRDGMGQRREVDGFLLAHVAGLPLPGAAADAGVDVLAWASLADPARWLPTSDRGPYFPELRETSIEVWTEAELTVLHARAWADVQAGGLGERSLSAARWLMAEVQPDNATGRPWAAHVFAWLDACGIDDARLYAETLLHNTLVAGSGRPEPLSACILLDSARWLIAAGS